MEADFYIKARKWYNSLYVNPASERIVYFILLSISLFSLYQSIEVVKNIVKSKNYKNTYVLLMEHKDEDSYIKVNHLTSSEDQILSLIKLIINKYVVNMESFQYDSDDNVSNVIQNKSLVIKNLSGKDVYEKYMENSYTEEDGDLSLLVLKLKKIATIQKIEFLYEDLNIFEKFYATMSSNLTPNGAKVYFTRETTDERNKKKNLIATMKFNFYIDSSRQANSRIEFKVNDYYVEPNEEIEQNDDEKK